MNTYAIPTDVLKALRLGTADKDVRYYLKGVHLKSDGKTIRLNASNGHVLFTYSAEMTVYEGEEPPIPCEIIIPNESIDLALKATGKALVLRVDITGEGPETKHTIANIPFTPLDGRYPEAQRIWPTAEAPLDGKPCVINPDYFTVLGKVSKIMGVGVAGAQLWFDSNRLVFSAGSVRGLIMGMRSGTANEPHTMPEY